jgi:hypothetical protein
MVEPMSFRLPELSDEDKARVDENQAQEFCQEKAREETRRREWCVEKACMLDSAHAENLVALAEKIYAYVYGGRT